MDILKLLEIPNEESHKETSDDKIVTIDDQFQIQEVEQLKKFDVDSFLSQLLQSQRIDDLTRFGYTNRINAYDISNGCIRQTVYRLLEYPIPDKRYQWLPLHLRAAIGNAVHKFIQSVYSFDEVEVDINVPSLLFSGRLDALIGRNILVEIKTLPIIDLLSSVVRKGDRPRDADLMQALLYKMMLENYIHEIKNYEGNIPKHDSYSIELIQFIYVPHDIISSDLPLSEAISMVKSVRKELRVKGVDFIHVVDYYPDHSDETYYKYFTELIREIIHYVQVRQVPPIDHKFVNNKICYFCVYRELCKNDS